MARPGEALLAIEQRAARAVPGARCVGGGKGDFRQVVHGHRHDEAGRSGGGDERLRDEVDVGPLLPPSARLEESASGGVAGGDLGDEVRRAEDRELGAKRGEEMAAVPLAEMIGVHGDAEHERLRRALAADQDADRLLGVEGDHAARAPEVQLANLLLESGDGERRRPGKVRKAAAIPGVDEQRDVVGAAEAVGAQAADYRSSSSRESPTRDTRPP